MLFEHIRESINIDKDKKKLNTDLSKLSTYKYTYSQKPLSCQ